MNANAILVKIEEDAKLSAERIQSDAQAKAIAMKAASRDKTEEMHTAMHAKATLDSAELEQRMLRMAELDERKALLAQKRALIDEAFTQAQAKLVSTDGKQKRAFFLSQTVRYASGDETLLVGDEGAEWFDETFLAEANQALVAKGKEGNLNLATEKAAGCQGVVLRAHGAEVHCTFDAILAEMRPQLEQEVAVMLFGEV